ncbi:MAG: hypothetical protein IKK66_01150 [Ruminococcus sp.]|nr:hypothetical protein [Ruminococcus sp.]
MNRLITRTAAVLSAAVMSFCGTIGCFTASAEGEKEVTIVFDFGFDTSEIELGYRTDGNLSDLNDFKSFTASPGENVPIPLGKFSTKTHGFSGWTVDGFYGHTSGETYLIPDDYTEDELVFKAVWYSRSDERLIDMTYNLEYNGEPVERPEWLKDTKAIPGTIFEPNYTTIKVDNYGPDGINLTSSGLTDGEIVYKFGTKIVVGDTPIEFSPIWLREVNVTFTTGDVDRITGNTSVTFQKMENGRDELAANDRFSRSGFNLVGWTSSYDGEVYKPGQTVTFPGEDVTFTAVWEPKSYTVLFKTGSGGTNKKVKGMTDTTIICPDPEHTVEGKTFAGWKDSDGTIYPVGSEYVIKGALPGAGISLTGVWTDGEAPVVTTTAPAVTTTTATTTTAATTTTVTTTGAIGDNSIEFTDVIAEINKNYIAFEENGKYNFSSAGMLPDKLDGLKAGDTVSIGFWYTETETGRTINYISYADVVGSAATTTTVTSTEPTVTTTTTPNGETKTVAGDANCDGKVTIADSTAILQAIGNPDKYGLTAEGKANADCCNPGDGITPADALSIKRLDAKLIEKLPEIIEG